MTRDEIERLLDSGRLQLCTGMGIRQWYDLRRSGKTRTWKRKPERFLIPCKCGFKDTVHITESSAWELRERPSNFNPRTRE